MSESHGPAAPLRLVHGAWPDLIEQIVPCVNTTVPRIGVAVPIHNNAEQLEAIARSILQGLGPADRVALVENGSTDGSWDRLQALFGTHSRITLAQLAEPDAAAARNHAVGLLSDVDYIAFCDGDDIWFEDRLARVRAALLATDPDILVQPLLAPMEHCVDIEGATFRTKRLPRHRSLLEELVNTGNIVATSGLVLRRTALPVPLFANGLRQTQDYEAWCRFAKHHPHARFAFLDEAAGLYDRVGGLSALKWRRIQNVYRIRRSYASCLPLRSRPAAHLRRMLWLVRWALAARAPLREIVGLLVSADDRTLFRGRDSTR